MPGRHGASIHRPGREQMNAGPADDDPLGRLPDRPQVVALGREIVARRPDHPLDRGEAPPAAPARDEPVTVVAVDSAEKIEKALPYLDQMVGSGLVAISDVDVILYRETAGAAR